MPRLTQAIVTQRKNKLTGKREWYARIRWKDADNQTHSKEKKGESKSHARTLLDQLKGRFDAGGSAVIHAEQMTFAELAVHYSAAKVIDPEYDGDIKVAGMQSKRSAQNEVDSLIKYWGAWPIQQINHADIEKFKLARFREPVVHRWRDKTGQVHERLRPEPRKMSSVNHELRRLRAMLNYARRRGWIVVNPFSQGDPLISEAAEIPRNRAENETELARLLAACTGKRTHLRAIILAMVDTALRLAEVKRLTREQIDFKAKVARVRARNTKGNKPRIVPLSERVLSELQPLCEKAASDAALLFDKIEQKKAWKAVKQEAGIADDLQLRDLRGWGTGRIARALAKANLPWQFGMQTTGHTQEKTYRRYLKTGDGLAQEVGRALAAHIKDDDPTTMGK